MSKTIAAWYARLVSGLKRHERPLLVLGIALQLVVLGGMIGARAVLLATGDRILLRVVPVDPRDIFRGDYVTLAYDFTQVPGDSIAGLGKLDYQNKDRWLGRTVYIALLPEDDGTHWRAGPVGLKPPAEGKYIRGTLEYGPCIACGIEAFYVQEGEGRRYEQAVAQHQLSAEVALTAEGKAGLCGLHIDSQPSPPDKTKPAKPAWSSPSDNTYRVASLPEAKITLDGKADETAWARANVERQFIFPWKKDTAAPPTEFRAFCDKKYLYFYFQADDADVVVQDELRDETDVAFEDRVELFFSTDSDMADYFCLEIDPRGRVYDYRAKFYREFDASWTCPGLEVKGVQTPQGYAVEGRLPLASLSPFTNGPRRFTGTPLPDHHPLADARIFCGLFRAEFSHDRSGRPAAAEESIHTKGHKPAGPMPIMSWMSWVDPQTPEPDFHQPCALGRLMLGR